MDSNYSLHIAGVSKTIEDKGDALNSASPFCCIHFLAACDMKPEYVRKMHTECINELEIEVSKIC